MPNDDDRVSVIFKCCGKRLNVKLAELKAELDKSDHRQFQCRNSSFGAYVFYDPAAFVALINKNEGDPDLTIDLHPL